MGSSDGSARTVSSSALRTGGGPWPGFVGTSAITRRDASLIQVPVDVRDAGIVTDIDGARSLVVRRAVVAGALHGRDAFEAGQPRRFFGVAVVLERSEAGLGGRGG